MLQAGLQQDPYCICDRWEKSPVLLPAIALSDVMLYIMVAKPSPGRPRLVGYDVEQPLLPTNNLAMSDEIFRFLQSAYLSHCLNKDAKSFRTNLISSKSVLFEPSYLDQKLKYYLIFSAVLFYCIQLESVVHCVPSIPF